jgi:uncharacterized protein
LADPAKNTVLRDNIRGNRLIPLHRHVKDVIDLPVYQRLRLIRQTGLCSFVFHTSEHSRFSHSIGAYATAQETFEVLKRRAEPLTIEFPAMRFRQETGKAFCLASLCHDIGHTAFSHALESTLLPHGYTRHDQCTLHLLYTDQTLRTTIGQAADIDEVILFIERNHPNRALSSLISGPFDVDRCDYLERDTEQAGVEYGRFDFQWLLHSLGVTLNERGQPIILLDGPRGLDALRQFLDARRNMYRQVYYHRAVRCAQALLKSVFSRIRDISGLSEATVLKAPLCFRSMLRDPLSDLSMGEFLATTDIEVLYLVRMLATEAEDRVLRELCSRFVNRGLPKCIVDSGKLLLGPETEYLRSIVEPDILDRQLNLALDFADAEDVLEELRNIAVRALASSAIDRDTALELAKYLVFVDPAPFPADPPLDFLFSFKDATPKTFRELVRDDPRLGGWTETFSIVRVFVPDECYTHAEAYLAGRRRVLDEDGR